MLFVEDYVGDWVFGFGFAVVRWEIQAGDLEAVEEQAGAFGVDGSGGYAAEDFADALLDGGSVFRVGDLEGVGAGSAVFYVGDWLARFVVVVAEVLICERGAAAAATVDVDVAADEAFGFRHEIPGSPRGTLLCKVLIWLGLGGDLAFKRERARLCGLSSLIVQSWRG